MNRGRGGASLVRRVWVLELAGAHRWQRRRTSRWGGAREVLTGARAVAKRRRTGGRERRWLELTTRAKEGLKELEKEGMRCGEGGGLIALL
jgi:hypothetical protein